MFFIAKLYEWMKPFVLYNLYVSTAYYYKWNDHGYVYIYVYASTEIQAKRLLDHGFNVVKFIILASALIYSLV